MRDQIIKNKYEFVSKFDVNRQFLPSAVISYRLRQNCYGIIIIVI